MPAIDRRNKAKVYKDGSSLISVGLTAEQAQEALGDPAATAGWYGLGYQAGGSLGRDVNAQRVTDESGDVIGTSSTNDDATIQNTTQQTDAVSLGLYEWLETHEVPVRYILPTHESTPELVQVHFHPAMSKDVGPDTITTQKGVRTMQFTLRGDKGRKVVKDVALDQSDWAAAGLDGAMDTVFAAA